MFFKRREAEQHTTEQNRTEQSQRQLGDFTDENEAETTD